MSITTAKGGFLLTSVAELENPPEDGIFKLLSQNSNCSIFKVGTEYSTRVRSPLPTGVNEVPISLYNTRYAYIGYKIGL